MILTCPQCDTSYEADAAKFPAEGRKVRCAKCGHVWHQRGPEPVAEPEPFAFEEPEPEPARTTRAPAVPWPEPRPAVEEEEPAPRRAARERGWLGRIGIGLGWVALIGVILVIGYSVTMWRQQIAGLWPQSSTLFARVGMKVNTSGLDLADVRHLSQTEDGQPVLVISGRLVNVGDRPRAVPRLTATLSDAGKPVYGWSFAASKKLLAPGQSASFRTRLSNPPAGSHHVEIRFADSAE